jgi:serine protease
VARGAKVINLSLGDSQPDSAEENAVAAAINAGVVVVAASGNGNSQDIGQPALDYPAADPGVIAVGASAIDDSNPASVGEKVASYSNWDGTNASWGLVAPGGDPCPGSTSSSCNDQDILHWIENIYTSTASDSTGANGPCRNDPNSLTGPIDCRILIAGTSQATPHVTGAVSLLLSVGAQPHQIKTLLCSTATPLPGGKAGCGRLNVYKAMAQAVGDPSP